MFGCFRMQEKGRYPERMTSGQTDADAAVESAWRELEAAWQDDAAHRRFIAFCSVHGQLAEAGRRYRQVRDGDPVRSADATRRLSAILGAAFATLDATRVQRARRRSPDRFLVLGMALGLLAYALLALLRRFAR